MFAFASRHQKTVEPSTGKRYFTVDQARRSLTLIRRIVADIQTTQAQRVACHTRMQDPEGPFHAADRKRLGKEFDDATRRLESLMEELGKVGVELRDPVRGMLDFPAIHDGREVLLCWKADEETVSFWHEVGAGFAGRKSVSTI